MEQGVSRSRPDGDGAVGGRDGAPIHLLHVIPYPRSEPWAIEATGIDPDGVMESWQADAQKPLDELAVDAAGERVIKTGLG